MIDYLMAYERDCNDSLRDRTFILLRNVQGDWRPHLQKVLEKHEYYGDLQVEEEEVNNGAWVPFVCGPDLQLTHWMSEMVDEVLT